jgi:acetolactate synthase I/II/III large subunit
VPRFTSSDGLDPAEAIFGRLDFGATAKDFGLRGDNVNSLSDFGSLLRNYEAGKGAEVWNIPISDKVVSIMHAGPRGPQLMASFGQPF